MPDTDEEVVGMNLDTDYPLLSSLGHKRTYKYKNRAWSERKKIRVSEKEDGTVVPHEKSRLLARSIQLPKTLERRASPKTEIDKEERLSSMQKCLDSKDSSLVHKTVIARSSVLGMLKESLSEDPSFFVEVVREEDTGVVFKIKDFRKFVVVVTTAFDELSINPTVSSIKDKVLQFLDIRLDSSMSAPRCQEWDSLKRTLTFANMLPMQTVLVRRGLSDTTKIIKVMFLFAAMSLHSKP